MNLHEMPTWTDVLFKCDAQWAHSMCKRDTLKSLISYTLTSETTGEKWPCVKKETILFSIIIKLLSLLMCLKEDLNIAQKINNKSFIQCIFKLIHTAQFASNTTQLIEYYMPRSYLRSKYNKLYFVLRRVHFYEHFCIISMTINRPHCYIYIPSY